MTSASAAVGCRGSVAGRRFGIEAARPAARLESMTSEKTPASEGVGAPSFDARLERLEAIVTELEEAGLPLEPAIERYQEGIELLRQCHGVLRGFQKQVEELTRDAEDALRPFDGDPDVARERT